MSSTYSVKFWILLCLMVGSILPQAETETPEEEEPELPLEEAMAAIDLIAPLPSVSDANLDGVAMSTILDLQAPLDYTYLKYLQIQEAQLDKKRKEEEQHRILFERFFTAEREDVVYDPAGILTSGEQRVLKEHLSTYLDYDLNPLFINILDKSQADKIRLAAHGKHEQILQQQPTGILVYYFYDQPESTFVYFSKKAYRDIPRDQQKQIQAAALTASNIADDPYYSIYQHITTFTAGLLDHFREVSPEKFAPPTETLLASNALLSASEPDSASDDYSDPGAKKGTVNIFVILFFLLILSVAGIGIYQAWKRKFAKPKSLAQQIRGQAPKPLPPSAPQKQQPAKAQKPRNAPKKKQKTAPVAPVEQPPVTEQPSPPAAPTYRFPSQKQSPELGFPQARGTSKAMSFAPKDKPDS